MGNRLKTIDVPLTDADLTFLTELLKNHSSNAMKEPESFEWTEYHAHLESDLIEALCVLRGE